MADVKMVKCAVCGKEIAEDSAKYYYAYSVRLMNDKRYNVCGACDRHFKHACFVVENLIKRFDREYDRM
jgi:DNA-directed RNA polymerase subunit RPC12/RpoP